MSVERGLFIIGYGGGGYGGGRGRGGGTMITGSNRQPIQNMRTFGPKS